jgi:predicted PurR-regulated permease PerM
MTDLPTSAGTPLPGNGATAAGATTSDGAASGTTAASSGTATVPGAAQPTVPGAAQPTGAFRDRRALDSSAGKVTWWSMFGTDRRKPVAAREESLHFVQTAVLRASVIVAAVGIGTVAATLVLWRLRVLLLLIFVSLFLAVLLHPAVSFFDRRGLRRGASTAIVFLSATGAVALLLFILFHPVYESATKFATQLPTIVRQAEVGRGQIGVIAKRLHLLTYVKEHTPELTSALSKLSKPALALGKTVVSGAVALTTIAVLTFFILLEVPRIFRGVLAWMRPDRAVRLRSMAQEVSRAISGYMLGNLATSMIAGVVVFVGLRIMGVPFALVLAIWVGLVDFLPLIGGLLAGLPTVALAFLHSVPAGIVMLIVFLVYQQLENHILNPVIMSRTVRLNPLWVLLAVLFGAEIGGLIGSDLGALLGALLAVPTASAIQVIARDLWVNRHSRPGDSPAGGDNAPAEGRPEGETSEPASRLAAESAE